MEQEFSTKLNPEHSLRTAYGIKGIRQKLITMHNSCEIDQNQLLLVKFPNLGSDNIIMPGTVNLSFNTELSLTADTKRMLVSNVGREIVKKVAGKFEGNEILSVDNFNIFARYPDQWKTTLEKQNTLGQRIITSSGFMSSCMKVQINTSDKNDAATVQDVAISNAYGNKFIILLTLKC